LNKSELRKLYTTKRQELSKDEINRFNKAICKQFCNTFATAGKTVHVYLPIVGKTEPDTHPIIDAIRANTKLVVSRSNFERTEMLHLEWDSTTQFVENKYGIPEPLGGTVVAPTSIDLVLVPLLAYDKNGYRVGYGKGFYDKFLRQCKRKTLFVGLSFFEPEDTIDDIHPNDVHLSHCVTPNTVYHFKQQEKPRT
jgi:5-formyltetrahydrofolate cyclo-ligase